jgi:predicted acylesterase/phospholipase RssA
MGGIVSSGMLMALDELGVVDVCDAIFGVSSGAINVAYWAAGGRWNALSIYYDRPPHGFVSRWRPS